MKWKRGEEKKHETGSPTASTLICECQSVCGCLVAGMDPGILRSWILSSSLASSRVPAIGTRAGLAMATQGDGPVPLEEGRVAGWARLRNEMAIKGRATCLATAS